MTVSRSQLFEVEHINQLATAANSKSSLPGTPYFSGTAKWIDELRRLRGDINNQLFYVSSADLIVSGPWIIKNNFGANGRGGYILNGQDYKQVDYYYPDPGTNGESVNTVVNVETATPDELRPVNNGTIGLNPMFTLIFDSKIGGTIQGRIAASGLSADVEFEVTGSLSALVTNQFKPSRWNFVAEFSGAISPGEFSIGITANKPISPPAPSFTITIPTQARQVASNAIHNSKVVYKIATPYELSEELCRVRYKVPIDAILSSGLRLFYETISTVSFQPSSEILGTGIWVGKTKPIFGIYVNPVGGRPAPYSAQFDLNIAFTDNELLRPKDAAPKLTSNIGKVSTAVEMVAPSYPCVKDTGVAPSIGNEQFLPKGGFMAFKAHFAKMPKLNTNGIALASDGDVANISVGYYRSGVFVSIFSHSMSASEIEIEALPFWIFFTNTPLVYKSDSQIQPPQININVGTTITNGTEVIQFDGSGRYAICAEFYNETMAMLNQLT